MSAGIEDRERTTRARHAAGQREPAFSWIRLAQHVPMRIALDDVPPGVALAVPISAAQLASATTARIGVETAGLYLTVTLRASIGTSFGTGGEFSVSAWSHPRPQRPRPALAAQPCGRDVAKNRLTMSATTPRSE
ncbi:hypothetical protein Tamer19_05000 [Cupriavidus sp. TA19]|uniref:hypothetical protein n=1 Tax=Cupriavidus sp. TA19 TaxID=701108 RepID=UPI0027294A56|nr:hypothetical protein [Cupriavidus sp. TA19]GLC91092.1 hypothetical protein Tamer19_05000 [Cupriavidus sp. TA19]